MTAFQGASSHPLVSQWVAWLQDQQWIIPQEATTLAARGEWLGCNDPFIAALYAAHLQGLMGPLGPRLSSQCDANPGEAATSDATRVIRRRITAMAAATWAGKEIDAEGVRTRWELEAALDWAAFFHGDGFAIRVMKRGRSRWRLVHRDRVANPPNLGNSETLRDGFILQDGEVVGAWVYPATFGPGIAGAGKVVPKRVDWKAPDGTPNIIHKRGLTLPGMLRGVTRLAPIIIMQRQLGGVLESHVAAKRLQAIFGMIAEAEDPEAWKKAQDDGTALTPENVMNITDPLCVWVKAPGTSVQFTDTKFNGADLADYLTICYKVECAVLQMPVDVVLCQMGNASLSSARAGLDQFDRTCQTEQNQHIASVSSIIDQAAVADEVALRNLTLPTPDWRLVMVGNYARPPKYSTDRLKDANTIAALIKAGVSETTAYEMFGLSWEDEQETKRAQAEFLAAQQPQASGAGTTPTPTPTDSGTDPTPAPGDQPAAKLSWWQRIFAHRRAMKAAA